VVVDEVTEVYSQKGPGRARPALFSLHTPEAADEGEECVCVDLNLVLCWLVRDHLAQRNRLGPC